VKEFFWVSCEQPGKNPIKDLHADLDKAVMEAYGLMKMEICLHNY
jgi:hypothetical protein